MKKAVLTTIIASALFATGIANAELKQNTISLGYAQSHVKAGGESLDENPSGVNIKYRYELDDKWGVASSFTYTNQEYDYYFAGSKIGNGELDYYSLAAGPTYRFNDYFSAYGLLGVAHGRAEATILGYSDSSSKTSVVYGAGIQFNPVPNWVVDASYEYTKLGDVKVGTWMTGIGYRF